MSEHMSFLPKADLLTLEELDRLCSAFVAKGVRKLRLTGGEPLVRRGIMTLFSSLSRHLQSGALDELTLTTNGSQLAKYAAELNLRRRAHQRFARYPRSRQVPRHHALGRARQGARRHRRGAGRRPQGQDQRGRAQGRQRGRACRSGALAHGRGMDITIIEVMPLGDIGEDRLAQYLPLSIVRARLAEKFTLEDDEHRTGGPARYVRVKETGGLLGFITPMTHNFCESCNRVRITCTGTLYMCLGQEDAADLRSPLRASESNEPLYAAIDEAITRKPKGHDFVIDRRHQRPALSRHMSVTGG